MSNKEKLAITALSLLLTGCSAFANEESETITLGDSGSGSETTVTAVETTITVEEISESQQTSRQLVAEWINDMIDSDPEDVFTDKTDYQYYARTLGLDKDYFLAVDMWEVYYNRDINKNREIDNADIYLIRLNPNKLLELYAERNDLTVKELCTLLSATEEQLYYNWGYNPASQNYSTNHQKLLVTYSDDENTVFGEANGENRVAVMSTHMLTVDLEEETVTYGSSVSDELSIKRRDTLKAFTDESGLYSNYSSDEISPAFRVNGIGIRAVIPLTINNAYPESVGTIDEGITPMINVSPYAYGCTDDDLIDIVSILDLEQDK